MIVTLTMNPSIDIHTVLDKVMPEKKLRCDKPKYEAGGGGINVSRVIRRLGGESTAVFPAGGSNGDLLKELLDKEQIPQMPVQISEITRSNLTVFEKSGEQQFRFVMPGAELQDKEWKKCLDDISKLEDEPDYIVISGSLPPGVPDDFYAKIAEIGRKFNSRVIIDTSGKPLHEAVESGIYMIKPNLREFRELIGHEPKSEDEMIKEAQRLCGKGKTEVVVISMGAGGALLVTKDNSFHYRTPTVTIQSKVGAGDSMTAGIVYRLSEGAPIEEAMHYGVAAGAAAVMTPGSELCRKKDVNEIYEHMKNGQASIQQRGK